MGIVDDLWELLQIAEGGAAQPDAVILGAQTLPTTLERGEQAVYDGHRRKNGPEVHVAVDTLEMFLVLVVAPTDEQGRDQVELARVDQGYTGT